MSDRKAGLNALAALKVQSAGYGTEIAVTTGDRILAATVVPDDGVSRVPNVGELTGRYNTRMMETRGQPSLVITGPAIYNGLTDLIFALAMGAVSGVTTTPRSLCAAKQRQYEEDTDLELCGSAVWTLDSDIEVMAAPDAHLKSCLLTVPENGEATIQATLLTGSHANDSATNEKTQINAVTFLQSCGEVGFLHHRHMQVKLWRGTAASSVVPVKSLSIGYDSGLSEDNVTSKNSSGSTVARPVRNAKPTWTLTMQLHEEITNAYGQGWDDDAVYHAIVTFTDTFGCAGVSQGDVNPSIDLSAAGDGSIGITLITGEAAQDAELTVATLNSGALIAAAIQTAIRSLTASDPSNQKAYDECTVTYDGAPATDYYEIIPGGHHGGVSAPVVSAGGTGVDHSGALKLGVAGGGTEQVGVYNVAACYIPYMHYSAKPDGRSISGIARTQSTLTFVATGCEIVAGDALPSELTAAVDALLEYDPDTGPVIVVRNERATDLI